MIFGIIWSARMVPGCIGVLRNEKMRKQTNKMNLDPKGYLRRLEAREEELNRVEDEFISVSSHTIKTPLTIIKGAVCLVRDGDLGRINLKQREMLDKADEQVDKLNDIISKLLDIYRVEMGKLALFKEKVSVAEAAEDVVEEMEPLTLEKNINLKLSFDKDLPYVIGDSERIEEVITNLVSNAIKFTPGGGGIEIKITEESKNIRVEVADNGEGVEEELMGKLFGKFVTTNMANPKKGGGIGLGLAVSRGIIEAHNGAIWAESEGKGKGSRFIFTLPKASF